jgi:hypothetical protein
VHQLGEGRTRDVVQNLLDDFESTARIPVESPAIPFRPSRYVRSGKNTNFLRWKVFSSVWIYDDFIVLPIGKFALNRFVTPSPKGSWLFATVKIPRGTGASKRPIAGASPTVYPHLCALPCSLAVNLAIEAPMSSLC